MELKGLVVAGLGALFLSAGGACNPPGGSLREEMGEILGPLRPFEGRLVSFPWASMSSEQALNAMQVRRLREVSLKIDRQLARSRTPSNLRDRAVFNLLAGNLDGAIDDLEEARSLLGDDPGILNDLAAAYLERARKDSQPQDLILALAIVDEVGQAGGVRAEACFNKSLILGRLFLETEARNTWRECLPMNGSPEWASEVKSHLARLNREDSADPEEIELALYEHSVRGDRNQLRQYVRRYPKIVREYFEEDLLPAWAKAQQRGRDSQSYLQVARNLSAAMAESGDSMAADSVHIIEASGREGLETLKELARGHLEYSMGLESYRRGDYPEAAVSFQEARDRLASAGSPFADWAGLHLARCVFQRTEYSQVSKSLSEILSRVDRSRYPTLAARALWTRGFVFLVQGQTVKALNDFNLSLSLFERLREAESLAAVHSLVSEAYEIAGDTSEAWRQRYKALSKVHDRDLSSSYQVWEAGAVKALRMSKPRAALYFQNEILRLARASGDPVALVGGLRGRAAVHLQLGDPTSASVDLAEANEALPRIVDATSRQILTGDLLLVSGRTKREINASDSVLDLTKALGIYQDTGYQALIPQVLLDRGRTFRAVGSNRDAENDLAAAVVSWEQRRSDFKDDFRRSAYFDQSRSLFSEMISLQMEQRQVVAALEYAERGKSRTLLDWISTLPGPRDKALGVGFEPLTGREIAGRLPEKTVLVEYWLLDEHLLIWTVREGRIRLTRVPVPAGELTAQVTRWLNAIREGGGGSESVEVREVSRYLWAPIARWVPAEASVVFVPDLGLWGVPFAALIDAERHYLVEGRPVSVAPSASIFVKASENGSRKSRAAGSFLLVGNPRTGREFQDLSRLESIDDMVGLVGRLYPDADLQVEAAATKEAFLRSTGRHGIVHFMGHSLANLDSPLLSVLVMASDEEKGDSGALYAHELLGRNFEDTRLVVLAACSTASGFASQSEGVSSLARPFMAAGVPSVVASLWEAEDTSSSLLFIPFYERLHAGDGPSVALRAAQLQLIRSRDEGLRAPAAWAAFEVIGGL